ncbi:hypothetical protein [Marinobacter caseinilyticus]|uniref:hypothetical protein n=1 Tax=Marinobacter caseinilyticus TaxID=2692195 RepID=UPI00140ABDA4|nr:hypothetical protein [Marinobacter caseinilyticus]
MRDLEIYIRDIKPGQVSGWLKNHLSALTLADATAIDKAIIGVGQYHDANVRISVYPEAFGKRYACLIIEGEELPWVSDLDFARSGWRALDTEIRCSPGDWKEGEPVADEKWWRLDDRGEQLVVWN